MSNAGEDPDITELLRDLSRELRRLQREVEPDRRLRPPTGNELARFTSEVAIPGLILMLKTQIQALELLRRTIRMVDGRYPEGDGGGESQVRARAEQLGQVTLDQMDAVLAELQESIDGRPADDRSQQLITDARELRSQIQEELSVEERELDETADDVVDIDVEAELRSLKDDVDDPSSNTNDDTDSDDAPGDDSSDGGTDTSS